MESHLEMVFGVKWGDRIDYPLGNQPAVSLELEIFQKWCDSHKVASMYSTIGGYNLVPYKILYDWFMGHQSIPIPFN